MKSLVLCFSLMSILILSNLSNGFAQVEPSIIQTIQKTPKTPKIPNENGLKLGAIIKNKIKDLSESEIRALVQRAYQRLHLMDSNNNWKSPLLEKISDRLISPNMDINNFNALIDQMVQHAGENPYLVKFLDKIEAKHCTDLAQKVEKEGTPVFSEAVALAMALQNLTKEEVTDTKVLKEVSRIFEEARQKEKIAYWDMGLFAGAKLATVEDPVKKFIKFKEEGKPDSEFGKYYLPINIWEARMADLWMGNKDNADAGWALNQHPPASSSVFDPVLGTGPTTFSQTRETLEVRCARPKEWADLYATWNMAFVSQAYESPMILTKLLIPEVNNYKDRPAEYIMTRVFTLYSYLHYFIFKNAELKRTGEPHIEWNLNKDLSCLGGPQIRKAPKNTLIKLKR